MGTLVGQKLNQNTLFSQHREIRQDLTVHIRINNPDAI
ncbi:MAG: hypothetical protein RLZ98_1495 [Pseudomonadota bacterium]